MLRIALPIGKSLEKSVRELFENTGITLVAVGESTHNVHFPDYAPLQSGVFLKPIRVPVHVANGRFDVGITGTDVVLETRSRVHMCCELDIGRNTSSGKTRVVIFTHKDNPKNHIEDVRGTVLSEYPHLTRTFFANRKQHVHVVRSPGSSEAEVPLFYQYGVALTETGTSLRKNSLVEVAEIAQSATCLIANKSAWDTPRKREAIETLQALLQSTIAARGKIIFEMNVPTSALERVVAILPAMSSPTVSHLANGDSAVKTVCTKAEKNALVAKLRPLGATGFIESPLTSVIS